MNCRTASGNDWMWQIQSCETMPLLTDDILERMLGWWLGLDLLGSSTN